MKAVPPRANEEYPTPKMTVSEEVEQEEIKEVESKREPIQEEAMNEIEGKEE